MMSENTCSKLCSGVLLFLGYHLILLLLALMNTAIWTTELPPIRLFHHPSLYTVVKGFNVFFGTLVIIVILIICFKIGDRVLRIANLRIRANYNFYLLMSSFLVVFFFPIAYVGIARHIGTMLVREKLTNFALLTLVCFVAIDSLILFVFAIFLLLTSIMSTMRSYNIFRHLVKLSEERQKPKRPSIASSNKSIKKQRQMRVQGRFPGRTGVYPGRVLPRHGVYPYPYPNPTTRPTRKNSQQTSQQSSQAQTPTKVYRVAPTLMQRYGYGYVLTPTLTPSYQLEEDAQQEDIQQMSESTVFLV